jgi:hypothetical protein
MKEVGYGKGYIYAHDTAERTAGLDCLPDALRGRVYYNPTSEGKEADFKERADAVRKLREELRRKRMIFYRRAGVAADRKNLVVGSAVRGPYAPLRSKTLDSR